MIDAVYKGWDPGGLVWYLFGPGRYNEHENPRVIATWDERPQRWQPEHVGPGEFDYAPQGLIAALQAPLKAAGLPVTTPRRDEPKHRRFFKTLPDGSKQLRSGTVRHLTLRNTAQDRVLSDAEWAHIAEEMMHRSGWKRRDDPNGARWAAVRHDDDGIHVVAVLVRQDTHKRMWPQHDYPALRRCARDMERLYGLEVTPGADGTAAVRPRRAEAEKAARSGLVAARAELREVVAQAAARTLTAPAFKQAIKAAGYEIELRYLPSGDVGGYKVARPGDVNAAGNPVWFSGGRLAPDLTMPKLAARWAQARRGRVPERGLGEPGMTGQVWAEYGEALVDRAGVVLRDDPSRVHGIAHAVGEVWAVLDHGQGRLITGPGARWDRAARQPHVVVPETGAIADELRWLARGLGSTQVPSVAAMQLGLALASLALQIATLLQDRGCAVPQVAAARQTSRAAGRPTPERPRPQPSRPVSRPQQRRSTVGRQRVRQNPAKTGVHGTSWRGRTAPPRPGRGDRGSGPARGK